MGKRRKVPGSIVGLGSTFRKEPGGEEMLVEVGGELDIEKPYFPAIQVSVLAPLKESDYPRVRPRARTVKHDGKACLIVGLSLDTASHLYYLLGHVLERYQAFVDHQDVDRYQADIDAVVQGR